MEPKTLEETQRIREIAQYERGKSDAKKELATQKTEKSTPRPDYSKKW